ncbi:MAG: hypothetical protein ACE5MB_11310, partial [Anaerolineae bacterium]
MHDVLPQIGADIIKKNTIDNWRDKRISRDIQAALRVAFKEAVTAIFKDYKRGGQLEHHRKHHPEQARLVEERYKLFLSDEIISELFPTMEDPWAELPDRDVALLFAADHDAVNKELLAELDRLGLWEGLPSDFQRRLREDLLNFIAFYFVELGIKRDEKVAHAVFLQQLVQLRKEEARARQDLQRILKLLEGTEEWRRGQEGWERILTALLPLGDLTLEELRERAQRHAGSWLRRTHEYLPQVYHRRPQAEEHLRAFMGGGTRVFLLLSDQGMGKTNLLCHTVEQWLAADGPHAPVVLPYSGGPLSRLKNAEMELPDDLYLRRAKLGDILDFVEERGQGRVRFVLLVDAIDEHRDPLELLAQMQALALRYSDRRAFKLVLALRAPLFARLKAELELERHPGLCYRADGELGFTLGRIAVDEEGNIVREELESLYEAYRERLEGHRPTTPYALLSPQARRAMTNPRMLSFLTAAYHGREMPRHVLMGRAMRAYYVRWVLGRRGEDERGHPLNPQEQAREEVVLGLVELMEREKRARLPLKLISREEGRLWEEMRRDEPWTPYRRLVNDGVIIEEGGEVWLGRDELLHYLLARRVREAVEGAEAEALLVLAEEEGEWGVVAGRAAQLMAVMLAQEGRLEPVLEAVREGGEPVAVLVPEVLERVEGLGDEAAWRALVSGLAEEGGEDGRDALIWYGKHLYRTGGWGRAEEVYQTLLPVCEREGERRRVALLCNELGLIYDARGQYEEALSWY